MRRFFILISLFFLQTFRSYCNANFNFEKNINFHSLVKSQFETERLFLVPQSNEDDYELADLLLDHDVTKYMDLPELKFSTKGEALKFLQEHDKVNHWEWTIKTKDKISIGQVGVSIDETNCVDIGYWLGKNFWRRGYAREACIFLFDKIYQCFDVRALRVFILEDNIRSIKLAKIVFDHMKEVWGEKVKVNEWRCWREGGGRRYIFVGLELKKEI